MPMAASPSSWHTLAKTDLLLLDDWGLAHLDTEARRDLLELLDDRHGHRSTLVTSQLPVEHWHEIIGDPTLADAILDRLVHNAYRITLKGESMRKRKAKKLTATANLRVTMPTLRRFAPTAPAESPWNKLAEWRWNHRPNDCWNQWPNRVEYALLSWTAPITASQTSEFAVF